MKRLTAFLMTAVILAGLCACGDAPATETTEPKVDVTATDADIAKLDSLYAGRTARHGDLHDHADSGPYSDGQNTLLEWKDMMNYINSMDYAAIVDHRQAYHMYRDDWDTSLFIGGSEAGTTIIDNDATQKNCDYAMLFADPQSFEEVLLASDGYRYEINEDHSGRYYPTSFTKETIGDLARLVLDKGGFITHVHPKSLNYMISENPEDYLFADYTGLEVLCGYYGNMSAENNHKAYELWKELLALDRRVYATSGSDSHRQSNLVSLSTLYSEEKEARSYLDQVRAGDLTAGPVGIRLAVGDTKTGGEGSFAGQRLVIAVGDFHARASDATHTYRVDVYDDQGLVFSRELTGMETQYFALDANASAKFYRAEVYDVTGNYQFAIGNPIWNADV